MQLGQKKGEQIECDSTFQPAMTDSTALLFLLLSSHLKSNCGQKTVNGELQKNTSLQDFYKNGFGVA